MRTQFIDDCFSPTPGRRGRVLIAIFTTVLLSSSRALGLFSVLRFTIRYALSFVRLAFRFWLPFGLGHRFL